MWDAVFAATSTAHFNVCVCAAALMAHREELLAAAAAEPSERPLFQYCRRLSAPPSKEKPDGIVLSAPNVLADARALAALAGARGADALHGAGCAISAFVPPPGRAACHPAACSATAAGAGCQQGPGQGLCQGQGQVLAVGAVSRRQAETEATACAPAGRLHIFMRQLPVLAANVLAGIEVACTVARLLPTPAQGARS